MAGRIRDAGWLIIFRGGSAGLRRSGAATFSRLSQSSLGGVRERNDRFGGSVVMGDFDANGRDDCGGGAPNENLFGVNDCGAVYTREN